MKTKEMELYVHIPFCAQKCKYCDFCSFQASKEQIDSYIIQLKKELLQWASFCKDRMISTVFIGGGTPSFIEAWYIEMICQMIRERFVLKSNAEITIEANPGTVSLSKLKSYKKAGINRISFGLQSTRKEELEYLGRIHTYDQFLQSFEMARKAGFENINVDLMSAIPKQNVHTYEETLRKIAKLRPEHISAYSLIIEEGTPFYEDKHLMEYLPSEEEEVLMYQMTGKILKEYGYQKYEISNYAREGYDCQHNLGYWSQVPYLGVGLGASSYLGGKRFDRTKHMEEYLKIQDFSKEYEQAKELSVHEEIEEFMFLGLRKTKGISVKKFYQCFGKKIEDVYGTVIEKAIKDGLMKRDGQWLSLTEAGVLVSNQVLCEFLLDV